MLQPISFKTAHDITQFLVVVRSKSSSPSILKATDGNLYLVQDLKKYIDQASAEELGASSITFKSKGSDNKSITLAQIKENLDLIQTLEPIDWVNSQFISKWNDKLYADVPFPALNTTEEINQAKKLYDNTSITAGTKLSSSMLQFGQDFTEFAQKLSDIPIVTPIKLTDVINSMQKDFLKITLIQEAKLKLHLLNQRSNLTNQKDIDSVNQWIKEIEENNANTKELLKKIIAFLKHHQTRAKAAKAKYLQFNPETMKGSKARLDELKEKEQKQQRLVDKLVERERILRNVVANVLFFGLPAVVIIALIVIPAVFASPLIGLGVMALVLGLSAGAIALFAEKIASFYSTLPHKFNFSLGKSEAEQLEQMSIERNRLAKDVYFWNEYNKLDPELREMGGKDDALIEALETDLREIKTFEDQLDAPKPSAETQPTPVSAVSIFKQADADPVVGSPTVTPANP